MAQITFQFDREYREKVSKEDRPNSWIDIAISVNDTYLYGSNEEGVTGSACLAVLDFLESVEPVLDSTQYIIELGFGPTWLALYPQDDHTVEVAKRITLKEAKERADLREVETARTVTEQAWAEAVLDAAHTFHDTVVDLNPSLEEQKVMQQIRTEIDRVEQLVEEMSE